MPGMDGIEATRKLPRQKVLILTTCGLDEYIIEALSAGSSGFLLKDAPVEELVRAVREVAVGDAQLSRRHQTPPRPGGAPPPDGDAARSRRAFEADQPRTGRTPPADGRNVNAEIGEALVVSEPTVKTHVSNVLQRLDLRDHVQAVIFAYENGLVTPSST